MGTLIFDTAPGATLEQILLIIKDYMGGSAYSKILVKTDGILRFRLERSQGGYVLYKCLLTPQNIKERYGNKPA